MCKFVIVIKEFSEINVPSYLLSDANLLQRGVEESRFIFLRVVHATISDQGRLFISTKTEKIGLPDILSWSKNGTLAWNGLNNQTRITTKT